MMPATPTEHVEKNTQAQMPNDQQDNKSNTTSPFMSNSVETPMSNENVAKQEPIQGGSDSYNVLNNENTATSKSTELNTSADTTSAVSTISNEMKQILSLLKRPTLMSHDYEETIEDDSSSKVLLYDYSTMEAWMNHPVKRFRSNEENKTKKLKQMCDLYAAFENKKEQHGTPNDADGSTQLSDDEQSIRSIKVEQNSNENRNCGEILGAHEIKREADDMEPDSKTNIENLFTSKGLVASFKDLDQIFDDTDDSPMGVRDILHNIFSKSVLYTQIRVYK